MQASSIQHLQMNRGIWIAGKKQKQSQVAAASSWPAAHRDILGAHTCPWSKFSLLVFKTALLQMAGVINVLHMNMVRTTNWAFTLIVHSWTNLGSQPAHIPTVLQPPNLLWCFRLASHKCVALVAISCFWNVRLEGNRKTISLFQTISENLISARLWKWLVCSCAALMKPSPHSTSTL